MANAAGYYHWPGLWVDQPPQEDGDGDFDISDVGAEVAQRDLAEGLRARVFRDGRFMFDFTNSPDASAHPHVHHLQQLLTVIDQHSRSCA